MSEFKIPTRIESERLVLRTFRDEDWKDLYPYYSDPECMKYTIRRTLTEGETWRTMCGMIGHWQLRRYGPYGLESKEHNKIIGVVGMWYPNDWPEPEIKWGLVRNFQGKGFAREAVVRIKEMVKEHLPDQQLISLIFAENKPSINLALSVGCTLEEVTEFRGMETHLYRHNMG